MATKSRVGHDYGTSSREDGFNVVIHEVVGRVSYSGATRVEVQDFDGGVTEEKYLNPAESAMLLIAGLQRDGTYEFPGPEENSTTTVEVRWSDRES